MTRLSTSVRQTAPWGTTVDSDSGIDITALWVSNKEAMIYRRAGGRLMIRLPFASDNKKWLRQDRRHRVRWNGEYRCWDVPGAWLNDLVRAAMGRYDRLYLIQAYCEYEKCAQACRNARGFECDCSCMGANHGAGMPPNPWAVVLETYAVGGIGVTLSCRVISPGAIYTANGGTFRERTNA